MNNRTTRVLAAALAASIGGAAQAQGVDLRTVDLSVLSLWGSAYYYSADLGGGLTYHSIGLTSPMASGSAGAAYAPTSLLLDLNQPFTFDFQFFMVEGEVVAGDGMTFVLTPDDPSDGSGLGSGGSGLGYEGSGGNSVAFAIDTFNFENEPVSPSIQWLQDGSVTPIAVTETGLADIRDPSYYQWAAHLEYLPSGDEDEAGTLTGTIHQFVGDLTFSVSAPIDWSVIGDAVYDDDTYDYLGRYLFYGFTAGSGLADDGHFVSSTTASVVPLPAAGWLLSGGIAALLGLARRRREHAAQ